MTFSGTNSACRTFGQDCSGLSQVETKQKSFPEKPCNHTHNSQKPKYPNAKNPIDRAKEQVSIESAGDFFVFAE
ncbi:MAG: hypothetical protein EBR09_09050, partial [Proteobacteria bacterium]|nr:hypothetical protein [Pseudomonadota bacterium]